MKRPRNRPGPSRNVSGYDAESLPESIRQRKSACCIDCGCWFGIRPGPWGAEFCGDCHQRQGAVFAIELEGGEQ